MGGSLSSALSSSRSTALATFSPLSSFRKYKSKNDKANEQRFESDLLPRPSTSIRAPNEQVEHGGFINGSQNHPVRDQAESTTSSTSLTPKPSQTCMLRQTQTSSAIILNTTIDSSTSSTDDVRQDRKKTESNREKTMERPASASGNEEISGESIPNGSNQSIDSDSSHNPSQDVLETKTEVIKTDSQTTMTTGAPTSSDAASSSFTVMQTIHETSSRDLVQLKAAPVPEMMDSGFQQAVVYGKPFLMRWDAPMERESFAQRYVSRVKRVSKVFLNAGTGSASALSRGFSKSSERSSPTKELSSPSGSPKRSLRRTLSWLTGKLGGGQQGTAGATPNDGSTVSGNPVSISAVVQSMEVSSHVTTLGDALSGRIQLAENADGTTSGADLTLPTNVITTPQLNALSPNDNLLDIRPDSTDNISSSQPPSSYGSSVGSRSRMLIRRMSWRNNTSTSTTASIPMGPSGERPASSASSNSNGPASPSLGASPSGWMSRYWVASESTRECVLAEVSQTSLLTFHAKNADAVNVKGSPDPLVMVQDNTIVTIYGNVGGGRYLTVCDDGCVRFSSSPKQVRTEPDIARRCEFLVVRCMNVLDSALDLDSDHLSFGDQVVLECLFRPGIFLGVTNNSLVVVDRRADASKFVLHSPTLRDLVQLNATSTNNTSPFLQTDGLVEGNDFEREQDRIEAAREREWMQAIAKNIPVDLAKKIFEFHRDWVRTARLTCKAWKSLAERKVRRIRVNGEFTLLETDEERGRLIDFVQRCPNLEVLTLRNVLSLTDEDVIKICENSNISALVLGGCRNLTDRSTIVIAEKLRRIRHLNMAVTGITDQSIQIAALHLENLRDLNLYSCTQVTVDGINGVREGFVQLEHINLRGTIGDSHLVDEFKRKKPHVSVLTGAASADSIWG